MATWTAPTRLWRAAAAVRRFALTLMNMPMMPEAMEQAAPTRKANAVYMPSWTPLISVSLTSGVFTTAMTAPMMTDANNARTAMVTYCRRMKATAPSMGMIQSIA